MTVNLTLCILIAKMWIPKTNDVRKHWKFWRELVKWLIGTWHPCSKSPLPKDYSKFFDLFFWSSNEAWKWQIHVCALNIIIGKDSKLSSWNFVGIMGPRYMSKQLEKFVINQKSVRYPTSIGTYRLSISDHFSAWKSDKCCLSFSCSWPCGQFNMIAARSCDMKHREQ